MTDPEKEKTAGSTAAAVQAIPPEALEKVVWLATLLQCVRGIAAERRDMVTLGEGMICKKIGEPESCRYYFVIFASLIAIAAFFVRCFVGVGISNRKKQEPPIQARPRMQRQAPPLVPDRREVPTMSPVTYTFRRQVPRFLPLG